MTVIADRPGGTEQSVDLQGRDSEMEYLVERYPDGELRLKTRPIGGMRWSAPVTLREGK